MFKRDNNRQKDGDTMTVDRIPVSRKAFTLVELLVVVAVVVTVMAFLIPSVKFVLSDRKIREAARMVDVFVTEAQTEAVNGGMGGIWIERDPLTPNIATRIYRIKATPPYTGDFLGATCVLFDAGRSQTEQLDGRDNDGNSIVDDVYYGLVSFSKNSSRNVANLVQRGDLIQFELKGPWYTVGVLPVDQNGNWMDDPNDPQNFYAPVYIFSKSGPMPNVNPNGPALTPRFKILRRPTRSSAAYLDMPKTTMIDLSKSGLTVIDLGGGPPNITNGNELVYTTGGPNPLPPGPIQIIFGQDGSVETIYANGSAITPDRAIHLLLATDDRQTDAELDPANDNKTLADLSNFWLTISRQGSVSVTNLSDDSTVTNPNIIGDLLRASRRNARDIITTTGG